jgi:ABC-2 type transport system ATP-binding protein
VTAPVIVCEGLARWYGRAVGLTDLSVSIPPGITGLLGPNGAGKSTLLRLVSGLIRPSDGRIRVLGCDPVREPRVFARLGFVSEDDALYEDMSAREMVGFLARLAGYGRLEAADLAESCLRRVGFGGGTDRTCRGLSKGMRQKVRIAAALAHEPELLLLDEPMTGLDPVARRDLVELIRSLADAGRSVIFSSHILHEVESVARHVVLLRRGMLLAEGSLAHLRELLSDHAFVLDVTTPETRRLAGLLAPEAWVTGLEFRDGTLRIQTSSIRSLAEALPALACREELPITRIDAPNDNLEALFERLLG